jgi:poly(hydroxyalkanoate) granule-associated protein
MVTKIQKKSADKSSDKFSDKSAGAAGLHGLHLPGAVKDSAQQIWQAGLGAFAKAQAEGTKAFEALVKEGTGLQRKTQAAAEEKLAEATSRMSAMAGGISSKATGQWDKLESIFEERVSKALKKLGVPSSKDIDALVARIDELSRRVAPPKGKPPARKSPGAVKKVVRKTAKGAKGASKPG